MEKNIVWNKGLKKGVYKKCLICQKDFYVRPCWKDVSKYCSIECSYISRKGRKAYNKGIPMKGETKQKMRKLSKERDSIKYIREYYKNNPRIMLEETKRKIGKANKIALKGRILSKETREKISESLKGIGKGKNMSYETKLKISQSKQKENNFIPFKQSMIRRIRATNKYLEWRSNIFKRDNYHCQNCGKEGYLEAHHIVPFSYLISIFNIRSIDETIRNKALWDEGNGITYCRECHILLDKNIGNKGEIKI